LQAFGEQALGDLWERLSGLGPLHTTPELVFSGIAHGWAGALYGTLRWCEAAGTPIPDRVAARLEELAGWAEPVGRGVRWRAKFTPEPGSGEYYWVPGWCNGSAGFVYLWTLAHRMLGDNAYARHAEAAAWNAWETPGGPDDLCCGRAGRAYALLHLHHKSGDPEWWERAQSLAEQAAAGVRHSAYRHDTLYKGEIGVAVLAAEAPRPERACMPLFGKEA
jgi:serine/threonine-protein kinase